jgi:hypothetical protein
MVFWFPAKKDVLCVGDEFHVLLKDRTGRTVFDWHRQVTSHRTFPINGIGCPPICRTVTLGPFTERKKSGCQR